MLPRHLVLPAGGSALVSTDLHGNLSDYERLEAAFLALPGDSHWVLLGDLVHGPDPDSARTNPLYAYEDRSSALVLRVTDLARRFPARVHYVLGNHDHGHVGGPRTSKFHPDEVAALEGTMGAEEKRALRALFEGALLAVATPCGALLTHGAPDATLDALETLDGISLDPSANDARQNRILSSILRSYGQPEARTLELLANVSRPGLELRMVIHGHDRDEAGIFREGTTTLCPVLFGARREERRYVVLDLAARYRTVQDLRDGAEIRRVHA